MSYEMVIKNTEIVEVQTFDNPIDNNNINNKNFLFENVFEFTERSKPLSDCNINANCVMPTEGFTWEIIFNGGACQIHTIKAGKDDYITNVGAKSGYINSFIDMNGKLRCKFKGVTFEDVQKVNIKGVMKNASKSYYISSAIELYHLQVENKILNQGENTFYRNGLTLTITLGDCESTWSYRTRDTNSCVHSSWVLGDSTGQCGKIGNSYYFCKEGQCCSKYGFCGKSSNYCSVGCQHVFGTCY